MIQSLILKHLIVSGWLFLNMTVDSNPLCFPDEEMKAQGEEGAWPRPRRVCALVSLHRSLVGPQLHVS